jgi:hypothetical protein
MIRGRLIVSLVLAALAFGLPWVTHFADGGLSIGLHLAWLVFVAATLWTHGRRGLWLLLGAPLALFWPGTLVAWMMSDAPLRMF